MGVFLCQIEWKHKKRQGDFTAQASGVFLLKPRQPVYVTRAWCIFESYAPALEIDSRSIRATPSSKPLEAMTATQGFQTFDGPSWPIHIRVGPANLSCSQL